jgi:TBC1 domain family member 8/9
MSTISTQLRNFKEPDRDEQSLLFFAIPPTHAKVKGTGVTESNLEDGQQKMEINAMLSLVSDSPEDPYVRTPQPHQYLACPAKRQV